MCENSFVCMIGWLIAWPDHVDCANARWREAVGRLTTIAPDCRSAPLPTTQRNCWINDLFMDLRSGYLLIRLLESLTNEVLVGGVFVLLCLSNHRTRNKLEIVKNPIKRNSGRGFGESRPHLCHDLRVGVSKWNILKHRHHIISEGNVFNNSRSNCGCACASMWLSQLFDCSIICQPANAHAGNGISAAFAYVHSNPHGVNCLLYDVVI